MNAAVLISNIVNRNKTWKEAVQALENLWRYHSTNKNDNKNVLWPLSTLNLKLFRRHLKAVDNLTINEENRLQIKVEELTAKAKDNDYIIKGRLEEKDKQIQELTTKMTKMEESQLKITELLEVMKIAKSSDGKVGKDRTMLDENRRVTIGIRDSSFFNLA
jgi:hypothetical protein